MLITAITRVPNRLAKEKSPYLLQHAQNPVKWYPWGGEAFEKARQEDKPVFLSIGYSTCHWCHVMERESFEDREVADMLNRYYVAVKVDREERPEIDHIYMMVCQALTGQGGWPLTVIMTAEKKPFFAGTYFPKRTRWGRPGLLDLLDQIRLRWESDRESLTEAGEKITAAIAAPPAGDAGGPDMTLVEEAYRDLEKSYDPRYGGFGREPKFPVPHNLMFLLRYWKRTGNRKALEMTEKTLRTMYRGGIYDHIGFGFARYSTDRMWLVPHFEKMLYDNALLLLAYTEAFQATGDLFYRKAAAEIAAYVLRDMTAPEGGFYSAVDADSEGEEGKFYVWTPDEVYRVLGPEEGGRFAEIFDITAKGNFEGRSIPNLIAGRLEDACSAGVEESRRKLFSHREKRVHPFKDDKILTAWNGLMIAALARSAAPLSGESGGTGCLPAAEKAAAFVWERMRREDGRLLVRYRDGEALYPGNIDDYAFLQWGMLELYEATLEPEYLRKALLLLDQMKDLFWDGEKSGFYFYGREAEEHITRFKEIYDGAMPSGNSVAAVNIIRLARMTGRDDLSGMAGRLLSAFSGRIRSWPSGHCFFLMAVQSALTPSREIVIVGRRDSEVVREMADTVRGEFLPETVMMFRPADGDSGGIEEMIPFVGGYMPADGQAAAYICENYACREPVTGPEELSSIIKCGKRENAAF